MANRTVWNEKTVLVAGLSEFQRAMGKVSKEVAKQNRVQFKRIAEHVASIARGRIENNISGAAVSAIKGIGTNAGASIKFPRGGPGSRGDPVGYYPWLDFGGAPTSGRGVTSHRNEKAFFVRRTVIREGRYIYPAIAASTDYIVEQAGDIVSDVGRHEGVEVRG